MLATRVDDRDQHRNYVLEAARKNIKKINNRSRRRQTRSGSTRFGLNKTTYRNMQQQQNMIIELREE